MAIKVLKIDASLDLGKMSTVNKILLFPVLAKIFGIFKATVLLYGKTEK